MNGSSRSSTSFRELLSGIWVGRRKLEWLSSTHIFLLRSLSVSGIKKSQSAEGMYRLDDSDVGPWTGS